MGIIEALSVSKTETKILRAAYQIMILKTFEWDLCENYIAKHFPWNTFYWKSERDWNEKA